MIITILKIIFSLIFFIIISIAIYIGIQYYSVEDIPLNKIEAQKILDEQKIIYEKKSYNKLLNLMYSRGNEPNTFEIIGDSNITYQIEVESYWVDEDKKSGELLIYFTIDNGYRSAFHPMIDTFIKKESQ